MANLHQRCLDLLPWYVNGTLPTEEREALRTHIGECLPCRAEYRKEQHLYEMLDEQGSVPVGQDRGLSELLQRIDSRRRTRGPLPIARRKPSYVLVSAAVVMVVAGVVWTAYQPADPAGDEAGFSTLFGETEVSANRVDVIFSDSLTADDLARILDEIDASIAGGPTDLGRYTLQVRGGDDLDALIDRLRANPSVRFAGRSFVADSAPEPAAP